MTYEVSGGIGVSVLFGKCKGDLELVIRFLDPNVKVDRFDDGRVTYNFGSGKNGSLKNGAFKATAVDDRTAYGCNGSDVRIAVTSNSLTLLDEVINRIVMEARIQVVSSYPNTPNLPSGLLIYTPSGALGIPGVFLN